MNAAGYHTQYLAGINLPRPSPAGLDDARLQQLLPAPARLYGPELPGEPLLLARRQALLAVVRAAMPADEANRMDMPRFAAWLHEREVALAHGRELEQEIGHLQRHEQELDQERIRLLGVLDQERIRLLNVQEQASRRQQEQETELVRLREQAAQDRIAIAQLTEVRNSTSYRLGRILLAPVHLARLLRTWLSQ